MSAQAEIAAAITTADAVRASGKPHRRDGSIDCGGQQRPLAGFKLTTGLIFRRWVVGVSSRLPDRRGAIARAIFGRSPAQLTEYTADWVVYRVHPA